jgi:hypothetical protein
MALVIDPSSNVGLPLFGSGNAEQWVGFDDDDKLYMLASRNDMVIPPKGGKSRMLYRWYTCQTLYGSYTYTTLAWAYGKSRPRIRVVGWWIL